MALLKIKRKGERKPFINNEAGNEDILPLDSSSFGMSDAAVAHLKDLFLEKENCKYFRVAIRGGGCSGLSIHYEFSTTIRDQDVVFEKDSVSIVIDKKSLGILGGATLHVREYLASKEFYLVNNPAAKQCSCGQSFAL